MSCMPLTRCNTWIATNSLNETNFIIALRPSMYFVKRRWNLRIARRAHTMAIVCNVVI